MFLVGPDGADLRQLTDSSLSVAAPVFTADGATVLMRGLDPGPDRRRLVAKQEGLYAVDVEHGGRPHRLTDAEAYHLSDDRYRRRRRPRASRRRESRR